MTLNDLMELHMMAWIIGCYCLYAYVVAELLCRVAYGEASFELR